ncbi:hypothetical protein CLAFUW4_03967 [Fulvia fulva]|uniref:Uncharacterized protein n=1 Tax=Passalora fulva TaxID=5499 RepID=A0A9Q8LF15_PASFU|nr:uncharacterized protein CLAFUR5_03931 [Fulvia fulva]KAK4627090.1 hypothetical protein CLAFUR4_03953 [Fulvia fulva]KAK4628033.1 hypothetical protein CLAFUR0_03954 [Fulvia fulva]UJO16252.1 hypothetical protein CLAFUR5_03931 [Fulvia fulva]WPV13166.1 hypothetical protein CLAFUW4_03967 [Fulvia fulva]WPV29059.1 hypothetical protein CLAFUW7_03956 [Fulvia fulva]
MRELLQDEASLERPVANDLWGFRFDRDLASRALGNLSRTTGTSIRIRQGNLNQIYVLPKQSREDEDEIAQKVYATYDPPNVHLDVTLASDPAHHWCPIIQVLRHAWNITAV